MQVRQMGLYMRRLLPALACSILGAQAASAGAVDPASVSRAVFTIDGIMCGEVDPMVIGDACLARLHGSEGEELALIASQDLLDTYDDAALEQLRGRSVSLEAAQLERVSDRDALDILTDYSDIAVEASPYYWWDGVWNVKAL